MAESFVCPRGLVIRRASVDWRGRERTARIRRGEHVSVTDRDETSAVLRCLAGDLRVANGLWEPYLEAVR